MHGGKHVNMPFIYLIRFMYSVCYTHVWWFSYTDVEQGEIEMRGLESAAAATGNRASSGAAAGGGGEVRNTELWPLLTRSDLWWPLPRWPTHRETAHLILLNINYGWLDCVFAPAVALLSHTSWLSLESFGHRQFQVGGIQGRIPQNQQRHVHCYGILESVRLQDIL